MADRQEYTIDGITVSATSYNQAVIAVKKIKEQQQSDKK